jgi:hypothetical protein
MLIGIFGGLAFTALFAGCVGLKNASVVKLAWPALFISLGLVFLYNGIPWHGHGAEAGGLIAGPLFVIMGVVPLLFWFPDLWSELRTGADADATASHTAATRARARPITGADPMLAAAIEASGRGSDLLRGASPAPPPRTPPPAPAPPATTRPARAPHDGAASLSAELEHLADLHRRGDLSDAEFEAAKTAAIERGGT